jgi:SAM-dependent methyltransferase
MARTLPQVRELATAERAVPERARPQLGGRCLSCAKELGPRSIAVREMNLGLGDLFHYGFCDGCGGLTLLDPPSDLVRYYPPTGYYSLRTPGLVTLADRGFRARVSFNGGPRLARWLARYELLDTALAAVGRLALPTNASILDVGAGSGRLVGELQRLGYDSVVGIEPFLPDDARAAPSVIRGDLSRLPRDARFDLIMFHHTLEHVPDPAAALDAARGLLRERGTVLLRLPLVGPAFEKYGVFWYGIDAPRHSFVPTWGGLKDLLGRTRFVVVDSYFDSTSAQFLVSEEFERGGNARARHRLGPVALLRERLSAKVRSAANQAALANARRTGDQIVVYTRVTE